MAIGATLKKNVHALTRRRDFLVERVKCYQGNSPSYDKAEAGAISFALRMIEEYPEEARQVLHKLQIDKGIYKAMHGVEGV